MQVSFGRSRFRNEWLAKHSLSLFLLLVLVSQTFGYHFLEWPDWVAEQRAHDNVVQASDYWRHFFGEYLLSILSDTYGVLLIVMASKWFYEQGSAESKDLTKNEE